MLADQYGIWLSWNNQQEGFEFPILSQEVGAAVRGDGTGHDVYGLGKINVIKDRGLAEYVIESFFPSQLYPFITASLVLKPNAYVDYILKWWETKRPIRFVAVTSTMEINTPASIEAFEWKEVAGSPGDIQFSLRLKEYRFYAAQQMPVSPQQLGGATISKPQPTRPDDRVPPKSYKLQPGEGLIAVAKKQLGDDSRWREIQKLNNLTDAQLKRLPVGLELKLPQGGAYA